MPDQSYLERIRHPSGALYPPREESEGESRGRWPWLVLGLVVLGIIAWRIGWLSKIAAAVSKAASAVKPISNPFGWV